MKQMVDTALCSTFIRCITVPYESICGPILTVMKHLSDTFN